MTDQSDAIRDGEQAAAERHQAEVEMDQALIAQKQRSSAGGSVPIGEQADDASAGSDGTDVISAGHGGGTSGDLSVGSTIGSPGAGTDPSETQTSSGGADAGAEVDAFQDGTQPMYEGAERTFEGEGTRPLEQQ